MSDNKFNENFKMAMEGIRSMADTSTVFGDPINTANGTTIIPVSKLSMGYASGGLDYKTKKSDAAKNPNVPSNFGGVGGSGITVSPVAFLIIDPVSNVIGLIERSPELIDRLCNVIVKDDKAE